MAHHSLRTMHNLLFLVLCVVPLISGAPQLSPNRHSAQELKRGQDRRKKCHSQANTYLTNYGSAYAGPAAHDPANDATATVEPYQSGNGYKAAPSQLWSPEEYSGDTPTGADGYSIDLYPTTGLEAHYGEEYLGASPTGDVTATNVDYHRTGASSLTDSVGVYSNDPHYSNGESANLPYNNEGDGETIVEPVGGVDDYHNYPLYDPSGDGTTKVAPAYADVYDSHPENSAYIVKGESIEYMTRAGSKALIYPSGSEDNYSGYPPYNTGKDGGHGVYPTATDSPYLVESRSFTKYVSSTSTTSSLATLTGTSSTTSRATVDILSIHRAVATAPASPLSVVAKRQVIGEPSGFIGPLINPSADGNPSVCNLAGHFEFVGGQLITDGVALSVDPGVSFISLRNARNGTITTDFSNQNNKLVWANPDFFGGVARFCQVGNEIPVALFTSADPPADCILIDLFVFTSAACDDGELASGSSSATDLPTSGLSSLESGTTIVSTPSTAIPTTSSSVIVSTSEIISSFTTTSISVSTGSDTTLSITSTAVVLTTSSSVFTLTSESISTASESISSTSESVSVGPDTTLLSTSTAVIPTSSSSTLTSTSEIISSVVSTTLIPTTSFSVFTSSSAIVSSVTSTSLIPTTSELTLTSATEVVSSITTTSVSESIGPSTTILSTSTGTIASTSTSIFTTSSEIISTSTSIIVSPITSSSAFTSSSEIVSTETSTTLVPTTSSSVITTTSETTSSVTSTLVSTSVGPDTTVISTSASTSETTSSAGTSSTTEITSSITTSSDISSSTTSSDVSSTSTSISPCGTNPPAYYIIDRALYSQTLVTDNAGNVVTGPLVQIISTVGDGIKTVDALAFNSADGYLYAALGSSPTDLIKISTADGSYTTVLTVTINANYIAGVIDENSQYWLIDDTNSHWAQVDVLPGSVYYGQLMGSGPTTPAFSDVVNDWAYVPGNLGGNQLYGIASGVASGINANLLVAFDRTAHTWEFVSQTVATVIPKFQSVISGVDSVLAVDSLTGKMYYFPLPGNSKLGMEVTELSGLQATGLADGARCAA